MVTHIFFFSDLLFYLGQQSQLLVKGMKKRMIGNATTFMYIIYMAVYVYIPSYYYLCRYVEQLVSSAEAAVEEVIRRGVCFFNPSHIITFGSILMINF